VNILKRVLLWGAFVLALGFLWTLVSATRETASYDRSIAIQETRIDSLRGVLRDLNAEVKKAGEEAKELPDEARLGHATRSAFRIAKHQERVDGLITRARNRIQGIKIEKNTARRDSLERGWAIGATWLVLFVSYFWIRRR